MKRLCITFLLFAIIILSGIVFLEQKPQVNTEYLRIHIRANSNEEIDQTVKYQVKNQVVEYLTPFIADCKSKADAEKILNENLENIERVADKVLEQNGFSYKANAKLKIEQFPTRVYGNLELEKGFYKALIIELGNGEGDNWWCVVYPPLCFTGDEVGFVYKSKILEIINQFFNYKEKLK